MASDLFGVNRVTIDTNIDTKNRSRRAVSAPVDGVVVAVMEDRSAARDGPA